MLVRIVLTLMLLIAPAGVGRADQEFEDRVFTLLESLDAATAEERFAAEAELGKIAEAGAERAEELLKLLPEPDGGMPATVRGAVVRVRIRVQRAIARAATGASRVTLDLRQASLKDALTEVERQTGNRFRDNRAAFGDDGGPALLTLAIKDQPFWQAMDTLLDEADATIYPYGSDDELTIVAQDANASGRVGVATYAGPFRFEPVSLTAVRGLREPASSRLDLRVEVAWEPRLKPIALSQSMAEVQVTGPDGAALQPRTPDEAIELEAASGEQALQMTLSFGLPGRDVARIEQASGTMVAMIPATRREFRVEKVGAAEGPIVKQFGKATVTFERFTKQNEIWELHMRLQLDDAGDSLASHRGWVFQNPAYLVDASGTRYENAGFETTMQTENEIGLAYLFDLANPDFDLETGVLPEEDQEPADPNELTWVYETPSGVYTLPIDWKLGPVELP